VVGERIVEVERPSGDGSGWMIALVVGILIFVNMSNSGARKDDAIAQAASDLGTAATKAAPSNQAPL